VGSALSMLERIAFDGLLLDWQFPVGGGELLNGYHPSDWDRYVELLRELHAGLGAHKELSVVVGAEGRGVPMVALAATVDAIHLQTYNYAGPWDLTTGHNAPLWNAPLLEDSAGAAAGHAAGSVNRTVQQWLAQVNASQLVMGLAAFGWAWNGTAILYGQATGVGSGTHEPGCLTFGDIQANYLPSMTRMWSTASAVPYLVQSNPPAFISYDDDESIARKVAFARAQGFGGFTIWDAGADSSSTLLRAAAGAWAAGGA